MIATPARLASGGGKHAGKVEERFDAVLVDENGQADETGIIGSS